MRKKTALRVALLAGAAVLITTGVLLGQYSQTLAKSIRVCMECIGLG